MTGSVVSKFKVLIVHELRLHDGLPVSWLTQLVYDSRLTCHLCTRMKTLVPPPDSRSN